MIREKYMSLDTNVMTYRVRFLINSSEKGPQDDTITASSVSDLINQLFIRLQGVKFTIVSIQATSAKVTKRH